MTRLSQFVVSLSGWTGLIMLTIFLGCSPESTSQSTGVPTFSQNGSGGQAETAAQATGGNQATGSSTVAITGTGGEHAGSTVTTVVGDAGDVCGGQNIQITRKTPVVMFVVDRSGSTSTPYGNADPDAGMVTTRWQALHDAIMDPTLGVVAKTQSEIYIGITLFDGGDMATGPNGEPFWMCFIPGMCLTDPDASTPTSSGCPRLITVPPAKNNYDAIAAQYNETNAGPGGLTPTALALAEAYQQIEGQAVGGLDKTASYTPVVILVTDGEPNNCGVPIPDYQGPIDQVTAASQKDIKTFVIGIDTATGNSPAEVQPNLDNLAKLGNTGIDKAFTPTTKEELAAILVSLVSKASCEVKLNGKLVKGYEDKGEVLLNSEKLVFNDPNGFTVDTDGNSITIQGTACDLLNTGRTVVLSAKFPCDSFILE